MAEVAASNMTALSVDLLTDDDSQYIGPKDLLVELPLEVTNYLLSYLSGKDLCSVALCSRGWREKSNLDTIWHRLCKVRGWERFGITVDLNLKESLNWTNSDIPTMILTNNNAETLEPTCEWKVVFLKAWRLESCWEKNMSRYTHLYAGFYYTGSLHASDGRYRVQGYNERIVVECLNEEEEEKCDHKRHLEFPACKLKRVLVSKGTGLALGGHFFSTFDCESVKWLVSVRVTISSSDPLCLDGNNVIGRGSNAVGLNHIIVWSSVDGTRLHTLKGHAREINSLDLNGDMALSAAENLRLWDIKKGECLRTFDCPEESCMFEVCYMSDYRLMGGFNQTALFWDLKSDYPKATIHDCDPELMDFSDFVIGSLCKDGSLKIWDQHGELVDEHDSAEAVAVIGAKVVIQTYKGLDVWSVQQGGLQHLYNLQDDDDGKIFLLWADDTKVVFRTKDDGKIFDVIHVYSFW